MHLIRVVRRAAAAKTFQQHLPPSPHLSRRCRTMAEVMEANNSGPPTSALTEDAPANDHNGAEAAKNGFEMGSEATAERKEFPWKKAKKVAVMLSFSGKNYLGMQRNPGFPTIEEELLKAFRDSGAIAPEWFDNPQKAFFQRASRTDKGVSAAKMVISLKMLHEADTIDKINSLLPVDVKVHDLKRVTKNFNSKNSCDGRTYVYLMPTFAFCPVEDVLTEDYRMDAATRDRVNAVLKEFIGVHFFHNYTSGKLPLEPSSQRFITAFEIGQPFEREGLEFAVISVRGQSFMLHQIRKMIGMAIAVVRGHAAAGVLAETWRMDRIDVPRAPGLGLMLEEVHYDKYNKKFGRDGIHDALDWERVADDVERFKEDFIFSEIARTEKQERSMFEWMANLPIHTFTARHFESEDKERSALNQAMGMVAREDRKRCSEEEDEDE